MRPQSIALAATIVLTAGGLSTAAIGGAAPGDGMCDPGLAECVLVPPEDAQAYHAAFPDFGGPEDRVSSAAITSFERAAGRPLTWAYFSNNWFGGEIRFPTRAVEAITAAGRVPFLRLMARSGFGKGRDPNFSMRSIARGEWDEEISRWCSDAAKSGVSLLAEFGTEVNGDWFPWNGRWNGAGETSWRNPLLPDGPEAFQEAYRRIVDTCREEGANDVTWFFHVDVGGWPEAEWNDAWNYYPGDEYVDWVGLSDYGPLRPGQRWQSFDTRMDRFVDDLTEHIPDKPFAVLEYGAAAADTPAQQRRKAKWIEGAADLVRLGHWPQIHALSYWHESWKNHDGSVSNLRIDSSDRVRRAYRDAVTGEGLTSAPEWDER